MRKNIYTQEVDRITAPDRAVKKMLSTARIFDKKEKSVYMKGFGFKKAIAVSLAVVTVAGGIIGFDCFNGRSNQNITEDSLVSDIRENSFIITENAEEIGGENSAEVCVPEVYGLSLSESDEYIGYRLNLFLECIGENISTVTYSLDKDAVEVLCRKDNNPVVSGEISEKSEEYMLNLYTSVTFDYNNQNPEGFNFGIIGVGDDEITAHKDELFNIYGSVDELSLESQNNWLGKLIGNTIHCTVAFNDGTVQTQDIIIGTKISTYSREFPEEYSSLSDDIKEEKDFTGVFVTYSLA